MGGLLIQDSRRANPFASRRRLEVHFHRKPECDRTAAPRCGPEPLLLHGFDGVLVKPHANRTSHVHVLWDSTVIDSEADDAESHKASVPGLLGVLSLDEVSRDRRHCFAILECRSLLGMGASKIRKDEW